MAFDPSTARADSAGFDPSTATPAKPVQPTAAQLEQRITAPGENIDIGMTQGLLSVPEAIQNWGEHLTGLRVPKPLSDAEAALQQRAASTATGRVADVTGSVLPWVLGGEAAAGTKLARLPSLLRSVPGVGRILAPAARVAGRSVLPGLLQPMNPNDPNWAGNQLTRGVVSGLIGEGLHGIGSGAAALRGWTTKAEDEAAKYAKALKGTALRDWAGRTAYDISKQRLGEIPETTLREHFKDIYSAIGRPKDVPGTIDFRTPGKVRTDAGQAVAKFYEAHPFNDPTGKWLPSALALRNRYLGKIADPIAADRWSRAFSDSLLNPAARVSALSKGPASGAMLHDVVSKLGAQANWFGRKAAEGGVDARQYRVMADGLKALQSQVLNRVAPAGTPARAELEKLNRAYFMADTIFQGTDETSGAVPKPRDIIRAGRRKVGKALWRDPNFSLADWADRLQGAHERSVAKIPKPSATPPPTAPSPGPAGAIAHVATHLAGEPLRVPWIMRGPIARTVTPYVGKALAVPARLRMYSPSLAQLTAQAAASGENQDAENQ